MMKKLLFIAVILLLSTVALSANPTGPTIPTVVDANTVLLPGENVLIRNDFETLDFPASWDIIKNHLFDKQGIWQVATVNEIDGTNINDPAAANKVLGRDSDGRIYALQGSPYWDNYLVSVRAKIFDWQTLNRGFVIPLRANVQEDPSDSTKVNVNGYALVVNKSPNSSKFLINLQKFVDGSLADADDVAGAVWKYDVGSKTVCDWFYIAVAIENLENGGLGVSLYIDNNLVNTSLENLEQYTLQAGDNIFKTGKTGLSVLNTDVMFDEFLVVSLNGEKTTVPAYRAVALGQYNAPVNDGNQSWSTWEPDDALLVLGNGLDADHPSNAVVVLKNGNVNINGDVDIAGNLDVTEIEAEDITADNVTVNDTIETEDLIVNDEAIFNGDITAPNITATDSLKSEGTLTVEGVTSLNDSLTLEGLANLNGGAIVKGSTVVDNLTVIEKVLGDLNVEDNITLGGVITDTDGTVDVTGDLKLSGEIYANSAHITEETTIGGTLDVDGLATLNKGAVVTEEGVTIEGGFPLKLASTGADDGIILTYSDTNEQTDTESLAINGTEVIDKNGNWVGAPVVVNEPVSIIQSKFLTGTLPLARSLTIPLPSDIDPAKIVSVNAFVTLESGGVVQKIILPFDSEFGDLQSYKLYLTKDSDIVLSSIGEQLQVQKYKVTISYETEIDIPTPAFP